MKILIISYRFPPKTSVGGLRAYSFAKTWAETGHDVTVITVDQDDFNSTVIRFRMDITGVKNIIKIRDPYERKSSGITVSTVEKKQGNAVKSFIKKFIRTYVPSIGSEIFWAQKVISYLKKNRQKFDVVLTTSSPFSDHLIPLKIKNIAKFWIADFRDFPNQSAPEYSQFFLRRLYENYFINRVIQRSDMITTVSDGLADIIHSPKTIVIYNGFFSEYFLQAKKNITKTILYTGSLFTERNMENLLQVLKKRKAENKPAIKLHIYTTLSDEYQERLKNYMDVVEIFPPLPMAEIIKLQCSSLFLILANPEKEQGVMQTKSFEYFAAKRPIIALTAKDSELARKLELTEHPAYFCGYDEQELEHFIDYWAEHEPRETDFASQKMINSFSRENQAKKLMKFIQEKTGLI